MLKQLIDTISAMTKERLIWLRKDMEPSKLEKEQLVKWNEVKDCYSIENVNKLPKFMMNLELEINLWQLLRIFPHLRSIMEKHLLKMKET
jgi:hypothetical protein